MTANPTSRGLIAATLALLALGCSPAPAAQTRERREVRHAVTFLVCVRRAAETLPCDTL